MRLTREEKDILEAEICKDYEEITNFVLKNGLDYDGALLVLANRIDLKTAKNYSNDDNEDSVNEVPTDEILDACLACVEIASKEKK